MAEEKCQYDVQLQGQATQREEDDGGASSEHSFVEVRQEGSDSDTSIESSAYRAVGQTLASTNPNDETEIPTGAELYVLFKQMGVQIHRLEDEKQRLHDEMDMVYREMRNVVRTEREWRVNMSFMHDKKSAARLINFLRFASDWNKFERAKKSATILSQMWRHHSARTAYLSLGTSVVKSQALFRAFKVRRTDIIGTSVFAVKTLQRFNSKVVRHKTMVAKVVKFQAAVRRHSKVSALPKLKLRRKWAVRKIQAVVRFGCQERPERIRRLF